jgi:hypothetical protein
MLMEVRPDIEDWGPRSDGGLARLTASSSVHAALRWRVERPACRPDR